MHKPLRIIKDDARVRLTQQVNLTSALRAAFLTLPSHFSEEELFERIAGISYEGDLRMFLPAENRSKVANIVRKQSPQFRELYQRLAVGLPGVHWAPTSSTIEQDVSPHARAALLKKLPSHLLTRVTRRYEQTGPPKEADESAFWVRAGGDDDLANVLRAGALTIITRYLLFAELNWSESQKCEVSFVTPQQCKLPKASSAQALGKASGTLRRSSTSGEMPARSLLLPTRLRRESEMLYILVTRSISHSFFIEYRHWDATRLHCITGIIWGGLGRHTAQK
jgi:hypothetical protein